MNHSVKRIVFTGDFLRPAPFQFRPTQHENIVWLAKLLDVPLEMALGLPRETVVWDNNWLNCARIDHDTAYSIYQAMWLPPTIESWARIFSLSELPNCIEELFFRWFSDSLVIGFELPPYLVGFLDRYEIPFIDCSLSPIRFMDDLVFDICSNIEDSVCAMKPHSVSESEFHLQAGILSSNVAKGNPNPPLPNTLLVILQTSYDKAVISDRKFATVLDFLDELVDVAQEYDHILIKEHPLEPQRNVLNELKNIFPNVAVSTENFYRLLSHENLRGVAALTSSCVVEAGYFGKKGHYLMPGFTHAQNAIGLTPTPICDALIKPDFWREALGAAGLKVSRKDGLSMNFKPNRFRQQLRSAWGYNQIDSDIAVGWATKVH